MSYHTRQRGQTNQRTGGTTQQSTRTSMTERGAGQRGDALILVDEVDPRDAGNPLGILPIEDGPGRDPMETVNPERPRDIIGGDSRPRDEVVLEGSPIVSAGLYTRGGEYLTVDGKDYIGFYHIHADGTVMLGRGRVGVVHDMIAREVLTPIELPSEQIEDKRELTQQELELRVYFGYLPDYSQYEFPKGHPEELFATHRGGDGFYTCPPNVPPEHPITTECVKIYKDRNREKINRVNKIVKPKGKIARQLAEKIKQKRKEVKRDPDKRPPAKKVDDFIKSRGEELRKAGFGRQETQRQNNRPTPGGRQVSQRSENTVNRRNATSRTPGGRGY